MKVLILLLALAGFSYYLLTHHSPFHTEMTDPYYVEIRIDVPLKTTKLQLVGVGKMYSLQDCQARSLVFWASMLEHLGEVSVDTQCKKTLAERFLKLFDNQQVSATYIAYDKGQDAERDGRFLIYGAPSSTAYEACRKLADKEKKEAVYTGEIYCIKGSVG